MTRLGLLATVVALPSSGVVKVRDVFYRCGIGPAKEMSEAQMSMVLVGQRNVGKSRKEELGHPIQPVSHWHTLGTMHILS